MSRAYIDGYVLHSPDHIAPRSAMHNTRPLGGGGPPPPSCPKDSVAPSLTAPPLALRPLYAHSPHVASITAAAFLRRPRSCVRICLLNYSRGSSVGGPSRTRDAALRAFIGLVDHIALCRAHAAPPMVIRLRLFRLGTLLVPHRPRNFRYGERMIKRYFFGHGHVRVVSCCAKASVGGQKVG